MSERLLEQAFVEAESDPHLRAEIVIPRVLTAFLRHGPAAAVKLARNSASVVEDSGDLVLLTKFLAQLSFSELCADGVTPGVLERALQLERQVGPIPAQNTPTLVEGLRLMYADEHEPSHQALQREFEAAVARGDESAQDNALLFLTELACRAGDWGRADEYAEAMLQAGERWGLEFEGSAALWIRGLVDAYLGRLDRPCAA